MNPPTVTRSGLNVALSVLRGPETGRIPGKFSDGNGGFCAIGRIAHELGWEGTPNGDVRSLEFSRATQSARNILDAAGLRDLRVYIWPLNDFRALDAAGRFIHTWDEIADILEAKIRIGEIVVIEDVTPEEPEPEEDVPACWISEVEAYVNRFIPAVGPRNW